MTEWIGRTIGKVRIDQLLARGGMAEVYLGTHLTLDRPVAVKLLHSYIEDDPDLRERFQREARVVAGFRHPNIVQVYDFDTIEGHPYIVMEYLNGPTLGVYLRELYKEKERLSLAQVTQLLKGPAAALDYAHALGVIHRDIKPGNIMLHGTTAEIARGKHTRTGLEAVVTDFGLLRMMGGSHQTSLGTIAGTPNYMSPEQASGTPADYRTDIYSLGVVLYELLAGRAPFEGETTLTVLYKHIHEAPPPIPGISAEMQAVIDCALAKSPADRYQSCNELAAAFEAAVVGPAPETVRFSAPTTPKTLTAAVPTTGLVEAATTTEAIATPQTSEPTSIVTATAQPRKIGWIIPAGIAGAIVLAVGLGAVLVLPRVFATGSEVRPQPTLAVAPTSVPPAATSAVPSSEGMVNISAGDYQVGLNPPDDFHAAQQSLSLSSYWIDEYTVTNEQYEAYMQETGAPAPAVWPGDAKHPVRGVTWDQANAYCTWTQKRLPTEAEWEVAGRGSGSNPPLFPWGNDPTDDGKVLQMPDQDTYEVGSIAFNASPFGVYDLVGNVWQWVGDAYASVQEGYKILRGGRFGLPQDLVYRIVVAPDDNRYVRFAGFRCAADDAK